ncbi:allantoate amidohydrolase [Plantactinospora sp. KLBMP9567]|uniref:allantoate amidohydrolase n=1 Tax=Plantactinospora sp. KLBMP9567 TaxID=3085900 RepID=UPI0029823CEB|nr:allantoate amidohydrolase [Plantactinospora sp. KLBMP9567]MDW5329803.1 allantoate amidohydrolase [Plantactinospora sp. KLBMP9567]
MTSNPIPVHTWFPRLWAEIAPIGRDPGTGGYLRYGFTEPVRELERWFRGVAEADGAHAVEPDGNGNLIAWYGPPPERGDAVLLGSHFDSVPHGGGYDGPLGIVSALLAVRALRAEGREFRRPVGVVAFAEEEGSRFGVPCLGSRLLTGALDPDRAAALTDRDGVTLAEAMGGRPVGVRPDLLDGIGAFIELHVEQGRALVDLGAPVGVASGIWPHGRWRLDFTGEANHAGTTRMADRRDPMLTYAFTVLAASKEARLCGAQATIGRVEVEPNATNAIPARVRGWLDARAADAGTLEALVEGVRGKAAERASRDGTTLTVTRESLSPPVEFDGGLVKAFREVLADGVPVLPTAAGHDAGILAGHVPTAMLFVRNPTGVSHSPAEAAADDDCAEGVRRLADLLAHLAAG